ncbi:MAG: helix-turn-helix domain-containing protein [Terrimicrobiaceae bacterium]|nr:helix-turn-helix domain-containing protein [Terrimicrobiaceae bacterium]
MALGSKVLRQTLEVVDGMESAGSLGDLHGAFLRGLETLISGEAYDLVLCNAGGPGEAFHAKPGTYTPEEIVYMLGNAAKHPVAAAYATGASGAFTISQFVSDREWRSSPLFREGGYRRLRLTRELALDVPGGSAGVLAAVSIVRGGTDFSHRDREILNLLQPMISRAWQRVTRRTATQSPQLLRMRYPVLSEREAEVLYWITEGKLHVEIADILGVRLNTVQEHVQNIIRKLDMENRHQMTVAVLRACLS